MENKYGELLSSGGTHEPYGKALPEPVGIIKLQSANPPVHRQAQREASFAFLSLAKQVCQRIPPAISPSNKHTAYASARSC